MMDGDEEKNWNRLLEKVNMLTNLVALEICRARTDENCRILLDNAGFNESEINWILEMRKKKVVRK
jgi:hypothetical protein